MRRLLWLLLLLPACALHIVAPEPDVRTLQAVEPAQETSYIAAVARLPLMQLAAIVEQYALPPVHQGGDAGPIHWSLDILRAGIVTPRADAGALCLLVPFKVAARAQTFGTNLDKVLTATVDVCARPELTPDGALHLQNAVARVNLQQLSLPGPLSMLSDVAIDRLQNLVARQLSDLISKTTLPVAVALAPMTVALRKPMALQQQACLKLRPQGITTSQPDVDPTALRMAIVVSALPTVEQPCVTEAPQENARRPVQIDVTRDLIVPETRLLLPIGVGLEAVQAQASAQLITGKPLPLGKPGDERGWIQLDAIRLDSAKGALLIHVKVHGELADTFLWLPIHRKIDGEFVIWGVPEVTATDIRLTNVQLDMACDDRLVELGVALKKADLTAQIADKVRLPRETIEAQARQAVLGMARPMEMGGQQVPVRIEIKQLAIERVRAAGQRLEVLVRFVGQILVGATDRI
jgi:hypothetical protein